MMCPDLGQIASRMEGEETPERIEPKGVEGGEELKVTQRHPVYLPACKPRPQLKPENRREGHWRGCRWKTGSAMQFEGKVKAALV